MLTSPFARRTNSPTVMRSPDPAPAATAPAAAEQYATLGPMRTLQFGPGASPFASATGSLSPVVRAAAERISNTPVV